MEFVLDDIKFEVINITSRRRTISLMVKDNKIIIKSYRILDYDEIKDLLSKHQRFIRNRLLESKSSNSNVIHILGNEYKVETIISDFNNILIDDYKKLVTIYSKDNNRNTIMNILYNYYYQILKEIIDKNNERIKNEMDVHFDVKIEYKYVKTYFGECFPKKRLIIMNIKLAKYDIDYILSVLYHEYCHFHYMNHQKGFYDFLEKRFNNYKKINTNLRKIKYNDLY